MYSKDNGTSWEESTSNTHTFTNLTNTTEYDIKVKVVDSEGAESTEYYEAITTEVYILPTVTRVNATTTWNSITLTPSGTDGTNTIDHYEYSINNGAYQTSNVFSNLSENRNYTIKVKAIDSIGRESNVYTTTVRTDTYTLPTISVSTSATTNSITINVSATPGDGSIVSYHYSRDDGSNYTPSLNNSYTFSGLTAGTTYYLKVYVTDSNGRTSAVTSTSEATTYVNPSVSNVSTSDITSNSITINVTASGGSNNISRYYYSKDNGATWVNSASSSYTFTGLSGSTIYNFKVYVKDTAGHSSSQKSVSAETDNPTLANVCSEGANLASCIKEFSDMAGDGAEGIYYHDGKGSYTNANQEAIDNSYRFTGANPNNYVCFGMGAETEGPCASDNLYRIIGVFNDNENYQVKLIKSTSYGDYVWNENGNSWSGSNINNVLNRTYFYSLGSTWTSKIAEHTWQVGGMSRNDNATAKQYYNTELGNSISSTTSSVKIGLMYVSDYGYATSPENWTTALYYYYDSIVSNSNWLYLGSNEWTISPNSSDSVSVFSVRNSGSLNYYNANINFLARPTFYLNSNVVLEGGTGTSSDPYRLAD